MINVDAGTLVEIPFWVHRRNGTPITGALGSAFRVHIHYHDGAGYAEETRDVPDPLDVSDPLDEARPPLKFNRGGDTVITETATPGQYLLAWTPQQEGKVYVLVRHRPSGRMADGWESTQTVGRDGHAAASIIVAAQGTAFDATRPRHRAQAEDPATLRAVRQALRAAAHALQE